MVALAAKLAVQSLSLLLDSMFVLATKLKNSPKRFVSEPFAAPAAGCKRKRGCIASIYVV